MHTYLRRPSKSGKPRKMVTAQLVNDAIQGSVPQLVLNDVVSAREEVLVGRAGESLVKVTLARGASAALPGAVLDEDKISSVEVDSDAHRAGLMANDVLVQINGWDVVPGASKLGQRSAADELNSLPAGYELVLAVRRYLGIWIAPGGQKEFFLV